MSNLVLSIINIVNFGDFDMAWGIELTITRPNTSIPWEDEYIRTSADPALTEIKSVYALGTNTLYAQEHYASLLASETGVIDDLRVKLHGPIRSIFGRGDRSGLTCKVQIAIGEAGPDNTAAFSNLDIVKDRELIGMLFQASKVAIRDAYTYDSNEAYIDTVIGRGWYWRLQYRINNNMTTEITAVKNFDF